ncbi:MAG: hypothetical protein ABIR68_15020 [Ilumatobacteraceae bacterium]
MDGFVELDSDEDHGRVWVRLAHITGIRVLEIHDVNGATFHTVSVLAGGEWFSDPDRQATAAEAAARADVLAGVGRGRGAMALLVARLQRLLRQA